MVIIGQMNVSSNIETVLFQRKFHFVIIGEGQRDRRKRHHQNCLIFDKMTMQQLKCSNDFIRYRVFLQKYQLVTIEAVQTYR